MKKNKGVVITLIAAVLWGFSGTCGQYIFDHFGADATYLTSVRLLSAGLILVLLGLFTDRSNMTSVWKRKDTALRMMLFAVFGLMLCQLTYMKTISYSNSGTATILQYIGPVFVMIVSCFIAKKLPKGREVFAIIMALLGTFIIATHGNIHTMVITPRALAWGIFSAVALASYTLLPVSLTQRFGAVVTTGYGMFIGGVVLCLISRVWEAPMIYDIRCILAFAAIVIFGTVLPFTMYIAGVARCGAVRASMLASIEPVSATVFMVVWLKEPFQLMDAAGFLCIFITIFLLIKKENSSEKTA